MQYLQLLEKASARLPAGSAFSGLTAAWLHGLDVEPCNPIYASVPTSAGVSTRAGMRLRRCQLDTREIVIKRGLPATSLLRTLRDTCLLLSLTESVVVADMALHKRLLTAADLARFDGASAGRHGAKMLSGVVKHAEPKTESPMETRLRMLVVLARLPRPEAQVPIYDGRQFLGRIDLYYRDQRLGLEYDGATHRESVTQDNRRQNLLMNAGIRLLRFTAGDIYDRPDVVVRQVRAALRAHELRRP